MYGSKASIFLDYILINSNIQKNNLFYISILNRGKSIVSIKKIITYGTYDMLHIGHINILKRAKAEGDYLIVGVTSEDYDRSRGKLNVSQNHEVRMRAIEQLDFVDEVILETHKNQKQEDIQKFGISKFVIGDDWVGKFDYLKEWTEVVYLPRTEGISSTQLRKEYINDISFGIVGINGDTKRFLREVKHVTSANILAVYSKKEAKLKKFKIKYGIEEDFSNYTEFLDSDIEAVYIATDIKDRYSKIKMALKARKHVLCENPLTLEEDQAEELFKIAAKKNRLLLMALKTAFAPAFNKMLDELNSGTIGDIKEIRSTFTSLYKERGFPKKYIENGATTLLMSYPSLLVQKIAGKSKSLTFFDQKTKMYDISNRAITTHKNNIIGISTVGIGMKSDGHAIISGTKGYVYIPAPWWLTKEFYFKFEDPHKEYHFKYEFEGDGLRYMISEFISLIQRGEIESSRLSKKDMLELNKIIVTYNKDLK